MLAGNVPAWRYAAVPACPAGRKGEQTPETPRKGHASYTTSSSTWVHHMAVAAADPVSRIGRNVDPEMHSQSHLERMEAEQGRPGSV